MRFAIRQIQGALTLGCMEDISAPINSLAGRLLSRFFVEAAITKFGHRSSIISLDARIHEHSALPRNHCSAPPHAATLVKTVAVCFGVPYASACYDAY